VPLIEVARQKSSELEERIRRRRLGGLLTAVGGLMEDPAKGDEDFFERLISNAEQL
jgi:DNA mismatch repair protein MSH3